MLMTTMMRLRRSSFVLLLCLCFVKLAESQSQMQIEHPPYFVRTPPKIVFSKENSSLSLECEATGNPGVTYRWKKDGEELKTGSAADVGRPSESILRISQLTADEALYQCIAENAHGIAFSNITLVQRATLKVIGSTKDTTEMSATEGQLFRLPASSFQSVPSPPGRVEEGEGHLWLNETEDSESPLEQISAGRRIQIADNGDLHFAHILSSDENFYRSAYRNEFLKRTVEGNRVRLTVKPNVASDFAPSLAFFSVSRSVALERENVTLRCFFYGKPEPTISWLSSDTLPGDRYIQSNHKTTFTLINVTKSDESLYFCMGENSLGSFLHNISLLVQAAPRFDNPDNAPQDSTVIEGDHVTFNCSAYADPEAQVTWFFNGKSLHDQPRDRFVISSDRKSLTIQSVCRECKGQTGQIISDTGVIQCNASNIHGYELGTGFLNVITMKQATTLNSASAAGRRFSLVLVFSVIFAMVIRASF